MSHSTPESKTVRAVRTALSFVLSVIISILTVAVCFNTSFLDTAKIEKRFTCYEYVCGVRESVIRYTEGIYDRNGLEKDNISTIISYERVKNVTDNFAGRFIAERVGYDEDSYIKSIAEICADVSDDISEQVRRTNQNESKTSLGVLMQSLHDYFERQVNVIGISKLATVINLGVPASYAVIGVSVFLLVFIVLILYFLGERRHRSVRAIAISLLTSGLFMLCLSFIVFIISRVKTIDIYPLYLSEQLMNYVDSCIGTVTFSGIILLVLALAVSTLAWIKKINGKG